MAHNVRGDSTASESLLPAAVTLAQNNHVGVVVRDDLKERSTSVTMQNVQRHSKATLLELSLVGLHALNSLVTELAKEIILLLGVDRQRTGYPGASEDVRGENSNKENVAASRDGLVLHHVVESLVTGLSAIKGKEHLAAALTNLLTGHTNNVLLTRLRRNVDLVEGVASFQSRSLSNLRLPVVSMRTYWLLGVVVPDAEVCCCETPKKPCCCSEDIAGGMVV